jgi:RNA-binding protein
MPTEPEPTADANGAAGLECNISILDDTSMNLTPRQIRELKKLAHHLKPVVMLGQQGVSENVINEIDLSLAAHELIKVRLTGSERTERLAIAQQICRRVQAEPIQIIGLMAVLYRPNPDKKKNRIIV